jgi:HAD superfamily hydrolase (TIGR01459 family)
MTASRNTGRSAITAATDAGAGGETEEVPLLEDASPLSARFPVWFCDVWGVVHDGVRADAAACDALMRHRENGGIVVFITNSPRPVKALIEQLDGLGVPRAAWDAIVTSGDLTQELVARHAGAKVFHLGPERDARLREGVPVTFTGPEEAEVVLCSGLFDDRSEQPEDYREMLTALAARGLPMICANPDLRVQHGDRILPCAGALAALYEELGGRVVMAGKPYPPIYEACLEKAEAVAGRRIDRDEILGIGDGLATDILGARNFGIAALYIAGGVHREELKGAGLSHILRRIREIAPDVRLVGIMERLQWKAPEKAGHRQEGETP